MLNSCSTCHWRVGEVTAGTTGQSMLWGDVTSFVAMYVRFCETYVADRCMQ